MLLSGLRQTWANLLPRAFKIRATLQIAAMPPLHCNQERNCKNPGAGGASASFGSWFYEVLVLVLGRRTLGVESGMIQRVQEADIY